MRGIIAALVLAAAAAAEPVAVRVAGPGAEPHLVFACELDAAGLEALFSDPTVIAGVKDLKAGIALAVEDLDPRTAAIVRRLNAAGIPLTAWLALPKDQGYYMNAGNAAQSSARFVAFQGWTARNGLRWVAVGLDIEPSLQEFGVLFQGSRWRLAAMLARRYFAFAQVARARQAYGELIRRIQAAGYPVQTYQFLFLADARRVHTTLLERLFGLVDVRGNDEVLMIYSSFQHAAGSALVWKYGPEAQTIAVGSTAGDPGDRRFGPLDWQELSNDLIVAAHFTPVVGVFSLEGCVRQGFLPRLKTMDWSRTVVIPAASIARVERFRRGVQAVLWTASRLPYFAAALVMALIVWFAWRRRKRIRARLSPALLALILLAPPLPRSSAAPPALATGTSLSRRSWSGAAARCSSARPCDAGALAGPACCCWGWRSAPPRSLSFSRHLWRRSSAASPAASTGGRWA